MITDGQCIRKKRRKVNLMNNMYMDVLKQ